MNQIPNFDRMKSYFEEHMAAHGANARGVDWKSEEAQQQRFVQLVKVIRPDAPFSLLDYGCAYGALATYLLRLGLPLQRYVGFDVLESMAASAREVHASHPQCTFTARLEELGEVDYVVASGIFNLKSDVADDTWTAYVTGELHKMDRLARHGFSFNLLTSYSDREYMRPHLYYADPCRYFDYCKRHFSRNVALLHDYEVYDFTIIVRK